MTDNLAAHTLDALIRNEPAEAVTYMQDLIKSRAQEMVYDRFAGGHVEEEVEVTESVETPEEPDAEAAV